MEWRLHLRPGHAVLLSVQVKSVQIFAQIMRERPAEGEEVG